MTDAPQCTCHYTDPDDCPIPWHDREADAAQAAGRESSGPARILFSFMVCECYVWPIIQIEQFARCGECHGDYEIFSTKQEALDHFKQNNNGMMPKPKGGSLIGWWELEYWQ